jgi:hypothetical protein
MDLTFHIIFCPGTLRYLRLAVLSLLRHSDYRYRLVSNGLGREELAELRAFCQTSPRLEYLPFPTREILPHGVLLSHLQRRETGSHFCFMDSDVFASVPFQAALEKHLADCDVFSSCTFMRWTPAENQVGYSGVCLETPTGLPLATSFFAIYRQEILRRIISETGVGFEDYPWPEHHEDRMRGRLAELGIDVYGVRYFDTGKLLNILSHSYGVRFRHVELSGLTHIGGLTMGFGNYDWKEWLARKLRRPYVLNDKTLEPASRNGDAQAELRGRIRARKRGISKFFVFFLRSLVDRDPAPRLQISDANLRESMLKLCETIKQVHQG